MGRNFSKSQAGATVAEFAIVLPVFLLLVFGIIEFGRFTATRAQIEAALEKAGEYGATLQGDCLTPARDRFFMTLSESGGGSELTFTAEVVQFTADVQAIQIVVTGDEPTFLPARTFAVHLAGFFPIEAPGGCEKPLSLTSKPDDPARAGQ